MSPAERPTRQRLDQLLVERGLAETRTRAQALILGGHVRVGEGATARTDRKSGDLVENTIALEVEAPPPFVSRGGLKLRAALDVFGVEPVGLVCLDVGSSTGGFTDLLLQRDAVKVYSVDVGRGQLAEALRHDPRVVSMERMNARALGPGVLPTPVDLAVVDVSFISLDRILRPVATCFGPLGGRIVALVKPQFEAGRKQVRDGVVRDRFTIEGHRFLVFRCLFSPQIEEGLTDDEVIERLQAFAAQGPAYFRGTCDRLHLYVTKGEGARQLGAETTPSEPSTGP
ncbi:MAG: TlyA family RNA methyltransferase [Candidatus Limnocylindrales bacterium]